MGKARAARAEKEKPPETSSAVAEPPIGGDPEKQTAANTGIPDIGEVVYYADRTRYVAAIEAGRKPEPIAGFIMRHNRNKEGELNGMVSLLILDPELGALPKRDVPYSPELSPGHWTPKLEPIARVNVNEFVAVLKPLVDAAVAEALEETTSPEGGAEADLYK